MPTSIQSKSRHSTPTTIELDHIRAYLARQGLDDKNIQTAMSTSATLNRAGIASALATWLATENVPAAKQEKTP
jgi:ribosomal protein L12E/L44/L45/RPP1/RPP2